MNLFNFSKIPIIFTNCSCGNARHSLKRQSMLNQQATKELWEAPLDIWGKFLQKSNQPLVAKKENNSRPSPEQPLILFLFEQRTRRYCLLLDSRLYSLGFILDEDWCVWICWVLCLCWGSVVVATGGVRNVVRFIKTIEKKHTLADFLCNKHTLADFVMTFFLSVDLSKMQ